MTYLASWDSRYGMTLQTDLCNIPMWLRSFAQR